MGFKMFNKLKLELKELPTNIIYKAQLYKTLVKNLF